MTYTMLASIVKYPFPALTATKSKFGFFTTEYNYYQTIAKELGIPILSSENDQERWARHPLVFLVEAADDICYEIMDIEDAHKLKILSYAETEKLLIDFFDEEKQQVLRKRISDENITDVNEKIAFLRASVIGLLENECVQVFVQHEEEILAGTFNGALIDHISAAPRKAYEHCTTLSRQRIYNSKIVLDIELSGYKIMETLMERMVEAVQYPERFYSKQLIKRVSSQYDIDAPDLESRLMAVIDYISGMTDVYALDVYQKINGISLPII